jgi:hypothetical protein
MDDEAAVAVLALHPSIPQIEEARIWLDGGSEVLGKEHRPQDPVIAQILELVAIEDDDPPAPKR